MSTVDLDLLKKQARADDFSDDDIYLQHLLDAAEEYVVVATNRTVDELKEMGADGKFPARLQQAIIMVAAHWYNQREAVSGVQMSEVPISTEAIIKQFRKLVNASTDDSGTDEV